MPSRGNPPHNMTFRHKIYHLAFAAIAVSLSSCSLMHDDLEPCPSGVELSFVYDYNIQRADMFNAHVGGVTVYVFDADGNYLTQQEEFNTDSSSPLAEHTYRMHLDLAPGTYQFIAVAHQKSYSECLASAGSKYRRTSLSASTGRMEDLEIMLDRENGSVNHAGVPLDLLWHGMSDAPLEVRDMEEAHQTISLMRDTKMLTVSLHQLDDPADISSDDFDIQLTAANGRLAHDNSLLDDELLTYTPYAQWTTEFTSSGSRAAGDSGEDILERTAHSALSFNRVILYPSAADNNRNAMLTVTNNTTGTTVARINLPDCLAQGRGAFEYYNYTPQEFLDREYNYKLDFFLRGDTWEYVDLSISIASWSKRIQRVNL